MDSLARALEETDRMYHHCSKAVGSGAGSMLTGGVHGVGIRQSKLSRAAEQYRHFHGWSYVAIRAIASRIAGQDVFVARVGPKRKPSQKLLLPKSLKSIGQRLEPLDNHALLDALDNPNPLMVRWSLMFSTVASMLLTGRGFWWFSETADGLQVWPIPSHWMEPKDVMRGSWLLKPFGGIEEHEIAGEDVAAFMLPDPSNPFGSISPLQTQAKAVATDEEIQNSQHRAFVNGVNPGLMIRVGKVPGMGGDAQRPVLTDTQRQEITEAILKFHGGTVNNQNPLIVDGMIEGVEKLTTSPQEMDFLDSGKQTKARIMQAFGVNPIIVGEIDGANRAQAVVAAQQFCESVNPIVELMSQVLTRWVGGRFNEELVAWIDPCRADDPEQRLQEWKAARANGDVTPNEFRRNVLNLADVSGGDEFRDTLGNAIERTPSIPEFSRNGSH
jgi:phage portal protein BeeE